MPVVVPLRAIHQLSRPKKLLPLCGKAPKVGAVADVVVVVDEDAATTIDRVAAGAVAARRLKAKVKVTATVLAS